MSFRLWYAYKNHLILREQKNISLFRITQGLNGEHKRFHYWHICLSSLIECVNNTFISKFSHGIVGKVFWDLLLNNQEEKHTQHYRKKKKTVSVGGNIFSEVIKKRFVYEFISYNLSLNRYNKYCWELNNYSKRMAYPFQVKWLAEIKIPKLRVRRVAYMKYWKYSLNQPLVVFNKVKPSFNKNA